MKKKFLITIIVVYFVNLSFAQRAKIDSLKNEFIKAKTDTSKVKLGISISWKLMAFDLDSALAFTESYNNLKKTQKLQSNYFEVLGIIHAQKYNIDSSLFYLRQCVQIDSISKNYKYLFDDYSNIANVYNISGQNDSALHFFNIADSLMQTYPQIATDKEMASTYYNKAFCLKNNSDYLNSIKYSIKAEKLFKKIGDKYGQYLCLMNNARIWATQKQLSKAFNCLTNITDLGFPKSNGQKGNFYKLKGNLYINRDSLQKAKKSFRKSIDAYKKQKNKVSAFLVYGNMINLYKSNGKIEPDIIKSIKELYRSIDNTNFIKYTYFNYLENIEMILNRQKKALQYNDSALLYVKNNLDKFYEYKNRGEILGKLEKYKEGYPFIQKAMALKDSVFSIKIKEKINELSVKYETEKKEQKIKLQEKENAVQKAKLKQQKTMIWLIVFVSALIIILIVAYIIYRTQKQKQEILKLQVEAQDYTKKEISSELHTGIGSELSAIILQLENKYGNTKEIEKIKKIYRDIRKASHILLLPDFIVSNIEDEINNLVTNIKTDNLEIETGIFSKTGWNDIAPLIQQNIYRIAQELFTNTIKHAQASRIEIQLVRHKDFINLSYEDNGKGYNPQEIIKSKGYQDEIIARTKVIKGTFTDDSKIGEGTILTFKFPI